MQSNIFLLFFFWCFLKSLISVMLSSSSSLSLSVPTLECSCQHFFYSRSVYAGIKWYCFTQWKKCDSPLMFVFLFSLPYLYCVFENDTPIYSFLSVFLKFMFFLSLQCNYVVASSLLGGIVDKCSFP